MVGLIVVPSLVHNFCAVQIPKSNTTRVLESGNKDSLSDSDFLSIADLAIFNNNFIQWE